MNSKMDLCVKTRKSYDIDSLIGKSETKVAKEDTGKYILIHCFVSVVKYRDCGMSRRLKDCVS